MHLYIDVHIDRLNINFFYPHLRFRYPTFPGSRILGVFQAHDAIFMKLLVKLFPFYYVNTFASMFYFQIFRHLRHIAHTSCGSSLKVNCKEIKLVGFITFFSNSS